MHSEQLDAPNDDSTHSQKRTPKKDGSRTRDRSKKGNCCAGKSRRSSIVARPVVVARVVVTRVCERERE